MTRLIIWRHGRTAWNLEGRVQGQTDVELDEVGLAQAAEAAPKLAALKPDLLISSDLRRAADTAAALGAITGLAVDLDPRLRERDFGPWQGLTREDIRAAYPDDFARWWTPEAFADQRIETIDDMMKRVGAALQDAATRVGDGTVVVVSHGGAAKAGCAAMLGWPAMLLPTVEGLGNCRYSELRRTTDRDWRLHTHNA